MMYPCFWCVACSGSTRTAWCVKVTFHPCHVRGDQNSVPVSLYSPYTAYTVTIPSSLVQLLAASAITVVPSLAVTMQLNDVHGWQHGINGIKLYRLSKAVQTPRLKCLISKTCILCSLIGCSICDMHSISAQIAGCMYANNRQPTLQIP